MIAYNDNGSVNGQCIAVTSTVIDSTRFEANNCTDLLHVNDAVFAVRR